MEKIEIKLSQEELEQLNNLLSYSPYKTIQEYLYSSLNDLPKHTNFNEPNNLLEIQTKE